MIKKSIKTFHPTFVLSRLFVRLKQPVLVIDAFGNL